MASAMTGGKAYSLRTTYPFSDGTQAVSLYLYIKVSQNNAATTRKSTLYLGMYIKTPSGWPIGAWADFNGSSLAGTSFDGAIPNFSGTRWLVSNIKMEVSHDTNGDATASIPWQWGVNSPWGGFVKPSGIYKYKLPNIGSAYTNCGIPTSLTLKDNGDNSLTLSCKAGSSGTNNTTEGVSLFITCDGTIPSSSNYDYTYDLTGSAGSTLSKVLSFDNSSENLMSNFLGADAQGPIKFTAQTIGSAGASYYSDVAEVASTDFTWYGLTQSPKIIDPSLMGEVVGKIANYRVTWDNGESGINNAISSYNLRVYNITTDTTIATYNTTNTYYEIDNTLFESDNIYRFYITAIGEKVTRSGEETCSGPLLIKDVDSFSDFIVNISDGNTVPSTNIFGDKVYIDIGSGNVLKLNWETPISSTNEISYYSIYISSYDPTTENNYTIYNSNIGIVNEFYVNSSILAEESRNIYPLNITLTAHSKYGDAFNCYSNTISTYIYKGCGIYVKVEEGYTQPIMKRAIALVNLAEQETPSLLERNVQLTDLNGQLLTDINSRPLYAKILEQNTNSEKSADWNIMQEFYFKIIDESWQQSDISYEILTDENGEIITDLNNEPIYTL